MRRVIQKTVTTTKIISLTIAHSEEEVEYALTGGADQPDKPEPPLLDEAAPAPVLEPERDEVDDESPDAAADNSNSNPGIYAPDGHLHRAADAVQVLPNPSALDGGLSNPPRANCDL